MPPLLPDALIDTPLRVEQTVPRAWVHKRSLDNVLVTEIRACGEDRFICAGRLPTAHRFFNDTGRQPYNDILFYTELGRQASLAVCHAFLNVALDDVFIFEGSHAALTDVVFRTPSPSTDTVAIEIHVEELTRRKNNAVSRVVTEHTMWIGSQPVFNGTGAFTIQPTAVFQRLRKKAAPVQPQVRVRAPRLLEDDGSNVTISTPRRNQESNEFTASLIVDQDHPYFFDHPCDHVPGMLLLEACAQLALTAYHESTDIRPLGITAYATHFTQFVECDTPVTLTASVSPDSAVVGLPPTVALVISQQGVVCGTTSILLDRPAGL